MNRGFVVFMVMIVLLASFVNPINFGFTKVFSFNNFIYMFFHGNIAHALGNILALYFAIKAIEKYRRSELIILSYITSVIASIFAYNDMPTVGLSCICWFLIGYIASNKFLRELNYKRLSITLFSLFVGFFFNNINSLLHLICASSGAAYQLGTYYGREYFKGKRKA